ncbi:HNH endonuclease [Pseudomonas syringae]|uniref:HNH endonuclease signature motif containing protein n=1 Tax=Pseudomonas syringae TaxID=317 RepID=UPI0003550DBB|nr:HNH endonuclease [Pseudomonas syringae]EPM81459.1 phage protein [Pseudomonas syringae pv. actinidiae ICMP 19068]
MAGCWWTGWPDGVECAYKWQQARLVHLNAHPICVYCERLGRVTEATVVDHSTPHRGDMKLFWDRSLWVSLCASCHSSVKQAEEAARLW